MEALRRGAAGLADAHAHRPAGSEVDFVPSGADGRPAGVEAKTSSTVRAEDFKHLAALRDRIGPERFIRGVVLYAGGERLPFGERLEARPLAALWTDAHD